jgi:hypothetical protein
MIDFSMFLKGELSNGNSSTLVNADQDPRNIVFGSLKKHYFMRDETSFALNNNVP